MSLALYVFGYRVYSRYLSQRVFALDPSAVTPAHALRDDIDYVPTRRVVLFGHHYASITGLSPMLGPAIAVIWGWLPGLLWVVLGALFVGCVHDFGALVVSMRARGMSIGKVTGGVIGRRAKTLFHLIIFFGIALAMGVFVHVIAVLFTPQFYPQAVLPSALLMVLAVLMGRAVYKRGARVGPLAALCFVLTLGAVWAAARVPTVTLSVNTWSVVLLGYALCASVLPVWTLLQPRDFINSLLLYLGLAGMYVGFFVLRPDFVSPAVALDPPGAPPMFPFVFIVIACGAVSGFHGLVSSGTTAKQISAEADARPIGYGGMIGESLLGLMAVLACTAGFLDSETWSTHYASWNQAQGLGNGIGAFISGTSRFLEALGLPQERAAIFVAVVVVSFALTTLDSATRLLRYNIAEMGETAGLRPLGNRYLASLLAVGAIAFFVFYKLDGKSVGLALWQLFGTTNQLLAGLTLLVLTLYLLERSRPYLCTLVPMAFMMVSTLVAMVGKLGDFWKMGSHALLVVGSILLVLAVWLAIEALVCVVALRNGRARKTSLAIDVE